MQHSHTKSKDVGVFGCGRFFVLSAHSPNSTWHNRKNGNQIKQQNSIQEKITHIS